MSLPVALVGCGRWGRKLLEALLREPAFAVVAVVDVDPAAVAAAVARAPLARTFSSLGELCKASLPLAAALVATPSALHVAHAELALEVGLDVFVEKPLSTSCDDARRLVHEARRRGRVAMVGHVLRYHPAVERLVELVGAGAIGPVERLSGRRFTSSGSADPLWTLGPHDLSTLHALDASEARRVVSGTRRVALGGHTVQTTTLDVELTSGATARFALSTTAPTGERRLVVRGRHGYAVLDELEAGGSLRLAESRDALARPLPLPKGDPLGRELAEFAACIAARREPRTSFAGAVWTVAVLEQASCLAKAESALAAAAL